MRASRIRSRPCWSAPKKRLFALRAGRPQSMSIPGRRCLRAPKTGCQTNWRSSHAGEERLGRLEQAARRDPRDYDGLPRRHSEGTGQPLAAALARVGEWRNCLRVKLERAEFIVEMTSEAPRERERGTAS